MNWLWQMLQSSWDLYYLSAPFVLFGVFMAGVLQVLLSSQRVVTWMGQPGLSAVARSALIGIPIPLCSCGVFPVSIALRRKGASAPSTMSFLITTPETSADAIVLTWAMLGPVMAIFRPLAAFFTGGLAGALAIVFPPPEPSVEEDPSCACGPDVEDLTRADQLDGDAVEDGSGHGDHHHDQALPDDTVGMRGLFRSIRQALQSAHLWPGPAASESLATTGALAPAAPIVPLGEIFRRIFRQAFLHSLDDIVFLLTLGILLAGVIEVLVPPDLINRGLGSGLGPMLLVLLVAIPMYTCASSSTPIAAALIAKGLSPGAALVLLLAGPAASTASMLLVHRHFGTAFLRIYLAAVVIGALVAGLALDALLAATGWSLIPKLISTTEGLTAFLQLLCVLVLSALMIWRLSAGGLRSGMAEVSESVTSLREVWLLANWTRPLRNGPRVTGVALGLAALFYLGTGLETIPPDSVGFTKRFGAVDPTPLQPGLHWNLPSPLGGIDVWRARYPRKSDVGFSTNLDMIDRRKELRQQSSSSEWHSPVTAMNADPEVATFLTGDENLLELSFTVHYSLSDPYAFFYGVNKDRDVVALYAENAARETIGTERMEELLTAKRPSVERKIEERLQARLDRIGMGIEVTRALIVDMHPPQPAVNAFRDVSSAREDKQTRIHQAHQVAARDIPLARGAAALNIAQEEAAAAALVANARGKSVGYLAQSQSFRSHSDLLRHLLWLETSERALANRRKYIVPPGTETGGVTMWELPPPTVPSNDSAPKAPTVATKKDPLPLDPNGDF